MAEVAHLPAQAYVYVIGAPDGPQKIGISAEPRTRMAALQAHIIPDLVIAYLSPASRADALAIEKFAHGLLVEHRLRGEWFDVTPREAAAAVKDATLALRDGRMAAAPKYPLASGVWKLRARRAGLSQGDLAKLAGVTPNVVSLGLRGHTSRGVPIYLQSIIRLWEIADKTKREDILAEPEVDADD